MKCVERWRDFLLAVPIICRRICRMLFTIPAAARFLEIDRRTVQRYVERFPEIKDGKKVDMFLLQRRD